MKLNTAIDDNRVWMRNLVIGNSKGVSRRFGSYRGVILGQADRGFSHNLHGVRAIGLEDANRPGGSDPVAVKEDHDLPNNLLPGPGVRDALGSNHADARHLPKPIGLGLDDVEDLLTEGLDHLPGIDRPDAADHPRAQIFFDPVDRARRRGP
jgi:hypothetical protein